MQHIIALVKLLSRSVVQRLRPDRWSATGIAGGCIATVGLFQALLLLGMSTPVVCGLILTASAAVCAGLLISAAGRRSSGFLTAIPGLCLVATASLLPLAVQGIDQGLQYWTVTAGGNPLRLAGLFAILLSPLVGCPLLLSVWFCSQDREQSVRRFGSCGLGVLIAGVWLAPMVGLQWTALCGACLAVAGSIVGLLRNKLHAEIGSQLERLATVPTSLEKSPLAETGLLPEKKLTISAMADASRIGLPVAMFSDLVAVAAVAAMCIVVFRFVQQFFPVTPVVVSSFAAGCVLMTALFSRNSVGEPLSAMSRAIRLMAAAIGCCGLFGLSDLFTQTALWMGAWIDSVELLTIGRIGLVIVGCCPIGLAAGTLFCSAGWRTEFHSSSRIAPVPLVATAVAALIALATLSLGITSIGSKELMLLAAGALTVSGLLPLIAAFFHGELSRRAVGLLAGLLAIQVLAGPFALRFSPSQTARLLFSTSSFLAYRSGYHSGLLQVLDDGRFLAMQETPRGTLTAWQHAGDQIQLRENGVPRGILSVQPDAFPELAGEVLPVVYPMAMADRCDRLLILGSQAGAPVAVAMGFPVQQLVCAEPDAGVQSFIEKQCWNRRGDSPKNDERFSWLTADAPLAVADASAGQFDVIVAYPDHVSTLRGQTWWTGEFLRRAARCLTADGIFCQRLQFVDVGPEIVAGLLKSAQTAFKHVQTIEIGTGDLVLLGSNSKQGLVRIGLADRMQRPQVTKALAQIGLDWSMALNLPTCSGDGLNRFVAGWSLPANTVADGRLSFLMPLEVQRWANKMSAVQTALNKNSANLLAQLGDTLEAPVLERRFKEFQDHQTLMLRSTDQFWAYRETLRKQIKTRAQQKVELVSGRSEQPPAEKFDEQRMEYFERLGEALRTRADDDVERLVAMQLPYDPLISYFVHLEAAELYRKANPPMPTKELRHRLHSVYYASPQDRALQPVFETMRLLRDTPDCEPNEQRRFDLLNSMLQVLQIKWEVRSTMQIPEDRLLRDIDNSVIAAEKTFETMKRIAAGDSRSTETWALRQEVMQRTLVRPLRNYREDLVKARQVREQTKSTAAAKSAEKDGSVRTDASTSESGVTGVTKPGPVEPAASSGTEPARSSAARSEPAATDRVRIAPSADSPVITPAAANNKPTDELPLDQ